MRIGNYEIEEIYDDGGVMVTKGQYDTADFFMLEFEELERLYKAAKAARPTPAWKFWAS